MSLWRLNLSLRSAVRYPNCGFIGSRPLSNLRERFWDRGCWVALDPQPFLHFPFVSPSLYCSILIVGTNRTTLLGLAALSFDTLLGKKKAELTYWTRETATPLCSFFGNGRNSHFLFASVALLWIRFSKYCSWLVIYLAFALLPWSCAETGATAKKKKKRGLLIRNGRTSKFRFAYFLETGKAAISSLHSLPYSAVQILQPIIFLFDFHFIALFVCWDGRNSHLLSKKKP